MIKIQNLGFTLAGEFCLSQDILDLKNLHHAAATHLLYVLVECPPRDEDKRVFYIGHTRRTFQKRMDEYRVGHGVAVNNRVHHYIRSLLGSGSRVEVWIWIDAMTLAIQDLNVDVAAGLEYSLITHYHQENALSKLPPLLNLAGTKQKPVIHIAQEDVEVPAFKEVAEALPVAGNFSVNLGATYWNNPVFNIPTEHEALFGEDKDSVVIEFVENGELVNTIMDLINRSWNPNGTPRIYIHGANGQWYRDWLHTHFQEGDNIPVEILGANHLRFIAKR